jgi:enterochelin esterase family protein
MDLGHFDVRADEFESAALRGNPAGDPARRVVPVLVPKGAGPHAARRFPVIYFLSGYGGSGRQALNWQPWVPSVPERLDRLRAAGKIGDVIAVFPDAFTIYGGSQYLNSAATGRYEDMIVRDLVPWIEARYPALPGARHRAVAGKSSGGYGALVLGMRHPDVFSAVACHSGDMYFDYCYVADFPRCLKQLRKHGGLEKFMDAFFAAPKKTSDLFLAMDIVAMAACYSPAPEKPWRVDLPFDEETGEIREDVWRRWLEHDPVRLAPRHADDLKKLRLLFLDCGSQDQFHLQYGLRILSRKLSALDVPHVVEEFEDDHTDISYRYETSLPRIWEAIRPEAGA